MGDNCFIVSKGFDRAKIAERIRGKTSRPVRIVGSKRCWSKVVVGTNGEKMTLIAKARKRGGDKFSGVILGLFNWCQNRRVRKNNQKDLVLDFIAEARMGIGVITDQPLGSNPEDLVLLKEVAKYSKGLIFTGDQIADAKFNVLL